MAATPKCQTDDEDDDKKVYPTNKVLFVDSHGVKSLPYRGRRTHFSNCIYLSVEIVYSPNILSICCLL
jgi:hypothetical protein